MIKQRNKNIHVFTILCATLEIVSVVGAYYASYFTKTRMGMLRHMIYLNSKWEDILPISTIKWTTIGVIIFLMILAYLKNRGEKLASRANDTLMLLTTSVNVAVLYFLVFYSIEQNRAYYIMSICFIIVVILQNALYHYFFKYIKSSYANKSTNKIE